MMKRFRAGLALICLLVPGNFSGLAQGEPPPAPVCVGCGMHVNPDSKFSAWVIDNSGKRLSFCEIGDMLRHIRDIKKDIQSVSVKDFTTGELIDGKKAIFVGSREIKTPMSWGIIAFKAEDHARAFGAPLTFDQAFGLLK